MNRLIIFFCASLVSLSTAPASAAEYRCSFYAQNPQRIDVQPGQILEREVEIVYTNTGTSTWQNNGGVVNLRYIELRPVNSVGSEIEGPLYHSTWINRKRVGSYLAIQGDVIQGHRARFVFKVRIDTNVLGSGTHDFYFRPYHAHGQWIQDWGQVHLTVNVGSSSSTNQPPVASIQGASMNPALSGTMITIIGSATNNPIEYRWESNGQFISNQPGFDRVFSTGTYRLALRARNNYGLGAWDYYNLVVVDPSTPATLVPRITSVSVRRTVIRSTGGSYQEDYDLVAFGVINLRRYQTLQLRGAADGGMATAYEWSLRQNGSEKLIGNGQNLITDPEDLYEGDQILRLRVADQLGSYSTYATFQLSVDHWPKLKFPLNGQWEWNFSDYGTNYHTGAHLTARDWNATGGALKDFGLMITACFAGVASVDQSSSLGNVVRIEYSDSASGTKLLSESVHLSTVLVKDGENVVQGQPLGLCGSTGNSTGPHLHHTLRQWKNNSWTPVIAEPIWRDDSTLLQVFPFGNSVNAVNLTYPNGVYILPEPLISSAREDIYGYGNHKYWAGTTSGIPTASAHWDFTIPISGTWKLFMHNPTGQTTNVMGVATHNTTHNAVFEINLPSFPGAQTYSVDQGNEPKGSLVEICRFDAQSGDRLMITQHNGTGESNREISFDDLVLKLISPSGAGGGGSPGQPQPSPSPSPNTSPTGPSGGGGGSSGGCSLSAQMPVASLSSFLMGIFILLLLCFRAQFEK